MTNHTTTWQRQDLRDAHELLTGLLNAEVHMPEEHLREASGLTERTFDRAVMGLLEEGRVQRHAHGDGELSYVLTCPDERETTVDVNALRYDERAVYAYLQQRPNTARTIAETLELPSVEVHRILNRLEQLGLVSFRYVGKLNIYRACS